MINTINSNITLPSTCRGGDFRAPNKNGGLVTKTSSTDNGELHNKLSTLHFNTFHARTVSPIAG